MSVNDRARQTIFYRNRRVTPDSDFAYDSIHSLIEATGREHLGQSGDFLPHFPMTRGEASVHIQVTAPPWDGTLSGISTTR